MAEPNLVPMPEPRLPPPAEVVLTTEDFTTPRFTPYELGAIKERYGRSIGEILTDTTTDEKYPIMAWLQLRRSGYQVELDDLIHTVIVMKPQVGIDPTSGELSSSSPGSVSTGE